MPQSERRQYEEGWYTVTFDVTAPISERILFPEHRDELYGLEDVRLTRFQDESGRITYYGTYNAYDGHHVRPKMFRSDDLTTFEMGPLRGDAVRNKGVSLFPRAVGGKYVAVCRLKRDGLYVSRSKSIRYWDEAQQLALPTHPWNIMNVSGCGPPIETDEGWLLLVHGVGPMRKYAIGALLLDLEAPERVIASLDLPLLTADPSEADGYTPNTLYSCGGITHAGQLVFPYGFADRGAGIATVPLDELMAALSSL